MIEMECGHWLDFNHWVDREKDHKIEKNLMQLEIKALKKKIFVVKDAVKDVKQASNTQGFYEACNYALAQSIADRQNVLCADSSLYNPLSNRGLWI